MTGCEVAGTAFVAHIALLRFFLRDTGACVEPSRVAGRDIATSQRGSRVSVGPSDTKRFVGFIDQETYNRRAAS